MSMQLTDLQSERFRTLIHDRCGIYLNQAKTATLQAKLERLLRLNAIGSYDEYYRLLLQSTEQPLWKEFVDEITVHQSSFFRENSHFEFIRSQLRLILEHNKRIPQNREIRVWSTACSTGEEPYTIAMVLKEWLPQEIAIRILATDISSRAVATAQEGAYAQTIKKDLDPYFLLTYFSWDGAYYRVKPSIKQHVSFRQFNLMEQFPFKDTFDLIFCRNVLIYFDTEVQERLLKKLHEVMTPGGMLFLGHSESLLNKDYGLKYLQPTIYQKKPR